MNTHQAKLAKIAREHGHNAGAALYQPDTIWIIIHAMKDGKPAGMITEQASTIKEVYKAIGY